MTSVRDTALMARVYSRFGHEGMAAATMRANVCDCPAHPYPHQRGIGRCVEPRVLSSEEDGP